uniref:Uncharacterized protein n=1 Tax=Aegilops tauschii subsp. strangulata TaxID=200361 RepID=A0A452YRJ7_AEGTS
VVVCQTTSKPPCTTVCTGTGTILYSGWMSPIRLIQAVNHALAQRLECINQTEVLASLLVKDAAVRAYRTDVLT